jgi:hypothetical protein
MAGRHQPPQPNAGPVRPAPRLAQPFWPQSDKSQGLGDGVPDLLQASFLLSWVHPGAFPSQAFCTRTAAVLVRQLLGPHLRTWP